ncbi:hypothetical protein CH295_02480 [Rhodococcus sp. 14-2483-1-2]|nr:hypothetical protein CH295_02480 [Rhodococcus sp. 14-2483-1-2]
MTPAATRSDPSAVTSVAATPTVSVTTIEMPSSSIADTISFRRFTTADPNEVAAEARVDPSS